MLRYILFFSTLILIITAFNNYSFASATQKNISIILPLQHQALDDIVDGIKETLAHKYKGEVKINVLNAMGDYNLQNALIHQAKNKKVDLILPVSTTVLQSAASTIEDIPVLGVAAMYSESERNARKKKNITVLSDEIDSKYSLELIQTLLPNTKKIAVVYSNNPLVYKELKKFEKSAQINHIALQKLQISSLTDLYTIAKSISTDTDLVFIFKDNTVASGIDTLIQQTHKLGIPLITSDEGTVKRGADLSLGVKEKEIGRKAGEIAINILNENNISNIPITYIKDLDIFFNKHSNLKLADVQKTSKSLGYNLIMVE